MIRKLLVANRGEIARRIFRTAHEMGIGTVAVYSDADVDAAFVADADESVALGGRAPSESYLRTEPILAAARATGADAVHPGYGFLSENAEFAQACIDTGLMFVGPTPSAIAAMGSKIEAKRRMTAAGVPLLPSAELEPGADDPSLHAAASSIGFPVLVKASAGGGGRGMRIVTDPAELVPSVRAAEREALSAFGDATVYLERYVPTSRHVEVQIFGDHHGRVIHLYERECSIQRRHQKIIEEAPSPGLPADQRPGLWAAAVAAGVAIGYRNAGTVEFLLDPAGGFYFLEVNTRLQVEHPVTEAITGLDLVRLQLEVASGAALPDQAAIPPPEGHAIEARIYAEDPTAGYQPSTGHLHRFDLLASGTTVRADTAFDPEGGEVTHHYDPMLAKVIAHRPTRPEAAAALARSLAGAQIHGVRTNRDLLVATLRHPEFLTGGTDTGFLDRHDPATLGRNAATRVPGLAALHAVAAVLAGHARRRLDESLLPAAPSGFRNVPSPPAPWHLDVDGIGVSVAYRFERSGALQVWVDGELLHGFAAHLLLPTRVDVTVGGIRRTCSVHCVADRSWVDSSLGSSDVVAWPRFVDPGAAGTGAGGLTAPMPGTVVAVHVAVGDLVTTGDPVVTMEAMKMELTLRATEDGTITELGVTVGDTVEAGRTVSVISPHDAEGDPT